MKRFISILFVTLLSIFILTNLSFAQKKAAKDMQVVVVIKDLLNPCFIEMKWGGFAAAKESGIQYNCLAPEKYSVDNQIRIVEDLVQKKVDAIVLIPIDGKGIVSGIERANKAGIPVFICNTRAEGGETLGFAGIDHKAMGVTIGEYVGKRLNGKGQIIILEGTDRSFDGHRSTGWRHGVFEKISGRQNPSIHHRQIPTADGNEGHGRSPDPVPED